MKTSLKQNETIVMKTRKHGLMLLKPFIVFLFLVAISIVAMVMNKDFAGIGAGIIIILVFYIAWKLMVWKNDLLVVTNLRVINEKGVLSISAYESPIDKVNNISYNQSLFGRIFNYGNVAVQSAADDFGGKKGMSFIKFPKQFKDHVTQNIDDYKREQIAQQAESMAQAIRGTQSAPIASTITDGEMKECPYCAEKIKLKAKFCKHCGKEITE